jgi:hypothetical protein
MNAFFRSFAPMLALTLALTACNTGQHLLENGNYDAAIDHAVQKLRGKKNKKYKHVATLEQAFQKANSADLARIERLKIQNRPENWTGIHDLYAAIDRRQDKVRPLTPLQAKTGHTARFAFVDVSREENESREKAAEFLYQQAQTQLLRGKQGDRQAARDAYYTLEKLEKGYLRHYRDSETLKREALNWGTSFVLFEVKNDTRALLPRYLNDRLGAVAGRDLDEPWKKFVFVPENGVDYDYYATLRFRDIDVSPERQRERSFVEERQLQDGFVYEYDARGNVRKDSLGNDIKRPNYIVVRAEVLEIHQTKAARVGATLDIADPSRRRLDGCDMGTEVVFENYACTFRGDQRALSEQTKARIGNRPLPFPTDEEMILDAAERLRPQLRDALLGSRAIF